jgi:hypothetical protein
MQSRPLMTLRLRTAPIQNIGTGPHGRRVTYPITGGSFEGDRLRGKVLPGGDDWTVERLDGVVVTGEIRGMRSKRFHIGSSVPKWRGSSPGSAAAQSISEPRSAGRFR